jgi:hypothetical protein
MKKQLLLGSALLAVISAFPQNSRMVDMAAKIAQRYRLYNSAVESAPSQVTVSTIHESTAHTAQARMANAASTITTWNKYTGSENIYGMLVSSSKPIQYNDELGRITFVHRKSHTYHASPLPASTASTGVIVADITNDWGVSFDSTALWTNDTYWARYPQGGIYNTSPTNTSAAQAYIIGTGPVTDASTLWQGNWFASKRLDCMHGAGYNNAPSTVTGAQQFIANSGSGTNTATGPGKTDYARMDFSFTDDGSINALGKIYANVNGTTFATQLYRGARVLKTTFSASTGTFIWSGDSLIPPAIVNSDGHAMLLSEPHMAWNEDGSVGYVWFIGCRTSATGSNKGNQPIVYKTTNHGATWTLIAGIDFTAPQMAPVLAHIPATTAIPALKIPFFNINEDMDGIVDMNGKLHIMSTLQGTESSDADSLNFSFQFPNADLETYSYPHTPGNRPYIYDFVGDGTSWSVLTVDSMSSEAPGSAATDDGFGSNPWDIDPTTGSKVAIEARLQMSRTPDGKYIVYTWAESDSVTTNASVKWNISPNIKARLLDVASMTIHPNEISVTDPPNLADANSGVRGFAFDHYVSPKCALSTTSTAGSIAIFLPMTVSNNGSLHQLEPVDHYFSAAVLNFDNVSTVNPPSAPDYRNTDMVGIAVNSLNSTKNSVLYPNPAKGSAVLSIDLKDNSSVSLSVMNMMGQQVKSSQTAAQIGQNSINVDLNGLAKGIYMVNVKVGTASSTKKLVVE